MHTNAHEEMPKRRAIGKNAPSAAGALCARHVFDSCAFVGWVDRYLCHARRTAAGSMVMSTSAQPMADA
jgi:hypothetical protein